MNRSGQQRGTGFHLSFLGQLLRQLMHHIPLKNLFGMSFSFHKNEFCKNKRMTVHIILF
jgi:hypothetical protein